MDVLNFSLESLVFQPEDWPNGLDQSFRRLRLAWAEAWPGLPELVVTCQHSLGLHQSDSQACLSLNHTALLVAQEIELAVQPSAVTVEPPYHNRLHFADVLVATATMIHIQRSLSSLSDFSQEWAAALLVAAVGHDFAHPGGINQYPCQLESASWVRMAPSVKAAEMPPVWVERLERLVLNTDVTLVAANHQRVSAQAFDWNINWASVLLNEADIFASATAEFGPSLSYALAEEWRRADFVGHATVATQKGRCAFLRSTQFSSPAALALAMPARIRRQLELD